MSQYPSPYIPPEPQGYGAPVDPYSAYLAPARRASAVMFVLGALLVSCGLCCVGVGGFLPHAQLPAEQAAQLQQMETSAGISMSVMFVVMGVLSFLPGALFIVMGFFVRRGGMGSIVTSIVLTSLALLAALLMFIGAMANSSRPSAAPAASQAMGICMSIGFCLALLSLLGLLLAWLIQATKAPAQIQTARAQYEAQYRQYYQQYQQHVQGQHPPQPQPPGSQQPPTPPPPAPPAASP